MLYFRVNYHLSKHIQFIFRRKNPISQNFSGQNSLNTDVLDTHIILFIRSIYLNLKKNIRKDKKNFNIFYKNIICD